MSSFRRCTLIVNPDRSRLRYGALLRKLRRTEVGRVVVTRDRRHLVKTVEQFLGDDGTCLLVYGGDGTIHQTITTLYERSPEKTARIGLGFLRGGSGNGYHDSYRVPRRLNAQFDALARSLDRGLEIPVDLLRVQSGNRVVYGQLAGLGFDAAVLKRRERGMKGRILLPGMVSYGISVAGAFIFDFGELHRERGILLTRDEVVRDEVVLLEKQSRALQIEMAKREFYGNGFKICPGARCDGGSQDVFLFNVHSPLGMLAALPLLWAGRHRWLQGSKAGPPPVEHHLADRVRVTTPGPFSYHVDGELMSSGEQDGSHTLEVSVIPRAVRFLVPERFYRSSLHTHR